MEGGKSKKGAVVAARGLLVGCAGIALYPHLCTFGVLLALSPAKVYAVRNKWSYFAEFDSAVNLVAAHDSALYWHGYRSAAYAGAIAREMGFRSGHVRRIHTAALLHDIGKIAIERSLWSRRGPLTSEEFEQVKQHSLVGESIVSQWDSMRELAPWIRHHHERMDGGGYPDGIGQNEIPIESRIIAVADAYDAMVGSAAMEDSHPYRVKREGENAMEEIWRYSGTQFDCDVVLAFQSAMAIGDSELAELSASSGC